MLAIDEEKDYEEGRAKEQSRSNSGIGGMLEGVASG
jgi:hypothetical protein